MDTGLLDLHWVNDKILTQNRDGNSFSFPLVISVPIGEIEVDYVGTFEGDEMFDQLGASVASAGDLNGDGNLDDGTAAVQPFTYTVEADVDAVLRVTDELDAWSEDTLTVAGWCTAGAPLGQAQRPHPIVRPTDLPREVDLGHRRAR